MTCQHSLAEKEAACADGMCPICAAARAELAQIDVARLNDMRGEQDLEINELHGVIEKLELQIKLLQGEKLTPDDCLLLLKYLEKY
jgi:hypothetical protein